MKYKVGDKVRVRTDLERGKKYGADYYADIFMEKAGSVLTITEVGDEKYRTEESLFNWTDEMLEPVEERRRVEVEEKYINDLMVKIEMLEKEIKELKGEELLPCPFCGSQAEWYDTEDSKYKYKIVCRNLDCLCMTDSWKEKEDAVKAWNRRVK